MRCDDALRLIGPGGCLAMCQAASLAATWWSPTSLYVVVPGEAPFPLTGAARERDTEVKEHNR